MPLVEIHLLAGRSKEQKATEAVDSRCPAIN